MTGHRRHVVGEKHAILARGPAKNRGIVGTCQSGVLDSNHVQLRPAPPEAAEDHVVEVLVGCEAQQRGQLF